jgi:hypothetical protein
LAERRLPASLEQILASHALLDAAEGHLFERAVIEAVRDAGLRIRVVEAHSIEVPAAVDALRRRVGPPWQKATTSGQPLQRWRRSSRAERQPAD